MSDKRSVMNDEWQMINDNDNNLIFLITHFCPNKEAALRSIVVSLACTEYQCGSLLCFRKNLLEKLLKIIISEIKNRKR